MITESLKEDSDIRVTRKMGLKRVAGDNAGNRMTGISYIAQSDAGLFKRNLLKLDTAKNSTKFWEEALYLNDQMIISAKIERRNQIVEIDTYEQLREIDSNSNHLKSNAIDAIVKALKCDDSDIVDISVLKKGMTNRSFVFSALGKQYIMRVPGEGTEKLIDRKKEADNYKAIAGHKICDDPILIDPNNGFKITSYLNNVRVCDCQRENDLIMCMDVLRRFHKLKLKVKHTFDIWTQIEFYESLWEGENSVYPDYSETKRNIMSLKTYIDSAQKECCLTHIDAVPDNFLFYTDNKGRERLQLTDWEYSGMQDPHVDIAMFCIYSLYNRQQCDHLIDIYFQNACTPDARTKIYCYIAMCGLLWSNWCEYKRKLGVEFGEYSLRQYRYAKEYYRIAHERISVETERND